ncbi:hypothetical protein PJP10_32915, partial [Mycobacterium kansasii]
VEILALKGMLAVVMLQGSPFLTLASPIPCFKESMVKILASSMLEHTEEFKRTSTRDIKNWQWINKLSINSSFL